MGQIKTHLNACSDVCNKLQCVSLLAERHDPMHQDVIAHDYLCLVVNVSTVNCSVITGAICMYDIQEAN